MSHPNKENARKVEINSEDWSGLECLGVTGGSTSFDTVLGKLRDVNGELWIKLLAVVAVCYISTGNINGYLDVLLALISYGAILVINLSSIFRERVNEQKAESSYYRQNQEHVR